MMDSSTVFPPTIADVEQLFAPPLAIHIFTDLKGCQFASVRIPETHQFIFGLSYPLFERVANGIFERTGRQIEREFKILYVRGASERIIVSRLAVSGLGAGDVPSSSFSTYDELLLVPTTI